MSAAAKFSTKVCPPGPASFSDTDLMKTFSGGVASDSLVPDAAGRVPTAQIAAHVSALTAAGVLKSRPKNPVGSDFETNMRALVNDDAELYNRLQEEYCFYESRYQYALKQFLSKATSRNPADHSAAQVLLANTKVLNVRVNGVLEVMNYLAASRVPVVNNNKDDINRRNEDVNKKLAKLRTVYDMLSKDNATILTQKEMVRYTEEKNNYTTNQIALWAAANIVALGVIFYVYRN